MGENDVVKSVITGLLGGVFDRVINDGSEIFDYMFSNNSWALKVEKLLSYMAFIMGATGPGQVVFLWIRKLFDKITLHFFGLEYNNSPMLFNGLVFMLSHFGQIQLHEIWEEVRDQSLCLIFDNCQNPGLQKLAEWKKMICNVTTKYPDDLAISSQTGCEQFFNEIPLIVLGTVMGGTFLIVKYYKLGEPPPPPAMIGPGPGDEMRVHGRQPANDSSNNKSSSGTSTNSPDPDYDPTPPDPDPDLSQPDGDGDSGPMTQPFHTYCPICKKHKTIRIIRPTPIFCCKECEKRSKLQSSANYEKVIAQIVQRYTQQLMKEIQQCLCSKCRGRCF